MCGTCVHCQIVGVDHISFLQKNTLNHQARTLSIVAHNESFSSRILINEHCFYSVSCTKSPWISVCLKSLWPLCEIFFIWCQNRLTWLSTMLREWVWKRYLQVLEKLWSFFAKKYGHPAVHSCTSCWIRLQIHNLYYLEIWIKLKILNLFFHSENDSNKCECCIVSVDTVYMASCVHYLLKALKFVFVLVLENIVAVWNINALQIIPKPSHILWRKWISIIIWLSLCLLFIVWLCSTTEHWISNWKFY